MSLKVKKKVRGNLGLIRIVGEATSDEVFRISKAIEDLHNKGVQTLALDVSETRILDSSALGMLILTMKTMKSQGRRFCLLRPAEYVKEILKNSNLDSVFEIVTNEDAL